MTHKLGEGSVLFCSYFIYFFRPRHTIRPPDIRELMIRSTETRTSKMIHLTHTLKQTIINYTPDPTITSTFPAFIITLLCIGNICVNGHRAADGAAGDWGAQGVGQNFVRSLFDDFHGYEMPFRWEIIGSSIFPNRKLDGCCCGLFACYWGRWLEPHKLLKDLEIPRQ